MLAAFAVLMFFSYFIEDAISKTGERDANGRFVIWTFGIQNFLSSFGLGYGPGGHAGYLTRFDGLEAHNVILDLGLQGGFIAITSYAVFCLRVYAKGSAEVTRSVQAIFLAVLVQQLAHYNIRQPLAWVFLVFPVIVAHRNRVGQAPTYRGASTTPIAMPLANPASRN